MAIELIGKDLLPPKSSCSIRHLDMARLQLTNYTWLTPTLSNHKVRAFPLTYRSLIQAGVALTDYNSSLKQAPPASMGIEIFSPVLS